MLILRFLRLVLNVNIYVNFIIFFVGLNLFTIIYVHS